MDSVSRIELTSRVSLSAELGSLTGKTQMSNQGRIEPDQNTQIIHKTVESPKIMQDEIFFNSKEGLITHRQPSMVQPRDLLAYSFERLKNLEPSLRDGSASPQAGVSNQGITMTDGTVDLTKCIGYLADNHIIIEGASSVDSLVGRDNGCESPHQLGSERRPQPSSGLSGSSFCGQSMPSKTPRSELVTGPTSFARRDIFRLLNHNLSMVRFNTLRTKTMAEGQVSKYTKATTLHTSSNRMSSPVLHVRGTDPAIVTIRDLCNLCSNYGNIVVGITDLDKNFSLIKFVSGKGAQLAKKHLNKFVLGNSKLSITLSKQDVDQSAAPQGKTQSYVPNTSCRRFKHDIPTHPNSVSRTLHVCVFFSHKRRLVLNGEVLQYITQYAAPIRIQRDFNKDHQNMWFVEFSSIAQATLVLMKCHDLTFEDGNLRISFTKSKRS